MIDSRSVIHTSLFLLPTFPGVGFGRLCVSRMVPFHPGYPVCGQVLSVTLLLHRVSSGAAALTSCVSDTSFFP